MLPGGQAGEDLWRCDDFLQLLIHLLLGYRELRDSRYYRDDPLVKRILGLKRLPDVGTISRSLKDAGKQSVENLRCLLRTMIFERLKNLKLARVTLDFDGSVQSRVGSRKELRLATTKRRKVSEAIIRYSVPSPRPVRWSTFFIDRVTFTIRGMPEPLF